MPHEQRLFDLDSITNARVRAVLQAAAEEAGTYIRPSHVLLGAIRQGDAQVRNTLSCAMRPGNSLEELALAVPFLDPSGHAAGPYRKVLGLNTQRALDRFLAAYFGDDTLEEVALELLLHLMLSNLEHQERAALAALDVDRAAALFRAQVENGNPRELVFTVVSPPSQESTPHANNAPFQLPPEIAPSEDLTERVSTAHAPAAFPFDGEPAFDKIFEALTRILHRRQAHHVLLTGERGVGKSTIVAELARRAATGQIRFLQQRRFLNVDCRYVAPEESRQRLCGIFAQVLQRPELIVCLDGFATLLRAERGAGNKSVLFSALAQARCQFIGLLNPREYEELVADDLDFAHFFDRVEVAEPDPGVALKILRHFVPGLEQKFQVVIEDEAVRQAVTLSANYILNDQLPAKALKILQRVCEDLDYERSQMASSRQQVTTEDVVRLVASVTGVPEETLNGIAERSDYEQSLGEVIFGQEHSVREVATELGLIKAGMTDPTKPASVMLFLGQTGTGKTEMAKALARFYSTSKRLKTYTLGNCVEPHSVATIIGVPPGYVGHHQGGRLVNDLNSDPYCVFLLDEADKAHPDVLQPFLNLFDEGWVCDQRGSRGYANRSIFILTSNVGQRMIAEMVNEGKSREEITSRMKEALSQIRHSKSDRPVFTPEFLSRIKRVIVFNSLDEKAMIAIARKLVDQMKQTWLDNRNKVLEISDSLVQFIGQAGYRLNVKSGGKEGGRIVRKLIAEWIESPLQRQISGQSAEYRHASTVIVNYSPPAQALLDGTELVPLITINFATNAQA